MNKLFFFKNNPLYLFRNIFNLQRTGTFRSLLGFYPRRLTYYEMALRHRSIKNSEISNERLEFLGDAVLNLVVSSYLFKNDQQLTEGELSKLRSKLVNRNTLNKAAFDLGIEFLLSTNIGDSDKPKNIYGNAVEALIGAVYLDRGLLIASDFVMNKVLKLNQGDNELLTAEFDFKSKVLEWARSKNMELTFKAQSRDNNEMPFECVLLADGKEVSRSLGDSKKQAEQLASKYFLSKSEGIE